VKAASPKISLVLGSHAHVPYGAGADEFEKVYAGHLRPFLAALYRHPRIQAVFHYSGVLLHWVERAHHELFMLIEDMVSRRQVEMLGGGFYEPVLPVIPAQDRIGQIEFLTTYIRKQFGKRPQGCWIPEFAWEQGLVGPLASCGMGFTFLSERQLEAAGAPPGAPCICEDQGKTVTVFPVAQSLEAALAGKSVSALLEDLSRDRAGQPGESVVSIFPGCAAQAGESPDCAWNRFFEELSLCEGFVETVSPGKLFKRLKGLRKVYVPDSAGEGAAPRARGFVIERPESGRLYSKMIFTNMMASNLRGDKARKISAYEELWKAQGGALFCRAGRGGIHDAALRSAAYGAMLGAEIVARGGGKFAPSLLSFDFDMDGEAEWLFQDAKLNCYVQPAGGGIFELDYLPKAWNYLDTCGGRIAFADRLLPAGAPAEGLEPGAAPGGRLCAGERYELCDLDKVRRRLRLALRKAPAGAPFGSIEIEKGFALKKDAAIVKYSLANRGAEAASFGFAPEIDISLPGETDEFARFFACRPGEADRALAGAEFPLGESPASGLLLGAEGLKIQDIKNEAQVALTASKPFDGRVAPVFALEGGERLFQAFCAMPLFAVSLEPGKSWEAELVLRFSH